LYSFEEERNSPLIAVPFLGLLDASSLLEESEYNDHY